MSDLQTQRDIGKLQGDMESLQRDVADIKRSVNTMLETILTAKGGWKTLLVVGSIGAAVATAATKLLGMLWR